jgi:hypothetical protein
LELKLIIQCRAISAANFVCITLVTQSSGFLGTTGNTIQGGGVKYGNHFLFKTLRTEHKTANTSRRELHCV